MSEIYSFFPEYKSNKYPEGSYISKKEDDDLKEFIYHLNCISKQ